MIKFLFITNNPIVAHNAEEAGVDRIFVDLETVGKAERQGWLDTVKSNHTVADVAAMRKIVSKSELFVRVNQIYENSVEEINAVIEAGADIVMLPYFKTVEQVKLFLDTVGGRAKTSLLFETPESVELVDEILALPGIDECYLGLNDLHLGYGMKFMFELVADGTTEYMCKKFRDAGKEYGFGGIARIEEGLLPADYVLAELIRLRSDMVILARSFCDMRSVDPEETADIFISEIHKMREREEEFRGKGTQFLEHMHGELQRIVAGIVEDMA